MCVSVNRKKLMLMWLALNMGLNRHVVLSQTHAHTDVPDVEDWQPVGVCSERWFSLSSSSPDRASAANRNDPSLVSTTDSVSARGPLIELLRDPHCDWLFSRVSVSSSSSSQAPLTWGSSPRPKDIRICTSEATTQNSHIHYILQLTNYLFTKIEC